MPNSRPAEARGLSAGRVSTRARRQTIARRSSARLRFPQPANDTAMWTGAATQPGAGAGSRCAPDDRPLWREPELGAGAGRNVSPARRFAGQNVLGTPSTARHDVLAEHDGLSGPEPPPGDALAEQNAPGRPPASVGDGLAEHNVTSAGPSAPGDALAEQNVRPARCDLRSVRSGCHARASRPLKGRSVRSGCHARASRQRNAVLFALRVTRCRWRRPTGPRPRGQAAVAEFVPGRAWGVAASALGRQSVRARAPESPGRSATTTRTALDGAGSSDVLVLRRDPERPLLPA